MCSVNASSSNQINSSAVNESSENRSPLKKSGFVSSSKEGKRLKRNVVESSEEDNSIVKVENNEKSGKSTTDKPNSVAKQPEEVKEVDSPYKDYAGLKELSDLKFCPKDDSPQ